MRPDLHNPTSWDELPPSEKAANEPGETTANQNFITQTPVSSITTSNRCAKFRQIGAGCCGSVWAQGVEGHAFKREDGNPGRSLLNDYGMHKRVLKSLDELVNSSIVPTLALRLQVPCCYHFTKASDSAWWDKNLDLFPAGYSPSNILCSERIPPLPQNVREYLIDQYCPASLVGGIKDSKANQDCLVRPYLGRRRQGRVQTSGLRLFRTFSLRNFPLHFDQMEDLDLDVHNYAQTMAEALAMMHWYAEVDANDVEFVLAAPRKAADWTTPSMAEKSALGSHTIWILDFDCCKEMPMSESGVNQAVTAFFRNDPFYPRPAAENLRDQALWYTFRDRYLNISSKIVEEQDSGRTYLPKLFIEKIEAKQREHTAAKVKASKT